MDEKPFTVLVAYNAPEPGAFALGEALRLVRHLPKGSVHLIHVASPRTTLPRMHEIAYGIRDDVMSRVAAIDIDHERFSTIFLRAGDPATEIVKLANELGAQLIVAGARRGRSFRGLLRDSVIEKIQESASCPVMVAGPTPDPLAPEIEPPCRDCIAVREITGGRTFWCERHSERHIHGHPYARSGLAFGSHDSEVVPTGVGF